MRIVVVLAVVLAACGSTLSPGVTAPRPSSTPIPWLAAAEQPTLIPAPSGSVPPPYPTSPPSPLEFLLEVPNIAFAGEPLSYVVRIRNGSPVQYGWGGGCPLYLEWLGGRDVSPTNIPGHIVKPLYPAYAGTAKEFHALNCATGGAVPAGGELAFEMRLDLPRDAVGPENLCWAMLPPPETTQVCTTIEFLPPRQ